MTDEKKALVETKEKLVKPEIKDAQGLTAQQQDSLLRMDVNKLNTQQKLAYVYYMAVRKGLDPALKPFDFIPDGRGGIVLYANASCADQLREINRLSVEPVSEQIIDSPVEVTRWVDGKKVQETITTPSVYKITFKVSDPVDPEHPEVPPRVTHDAGTYAIIGPPGTIADNILKAWTKGQRRATLGHCGIGLPDVSEIGGMVAKPPALAAPRDVTAPKRAPVDPPEKSAKAPTPPPVQPMKNGNGVSRASLEGAVQDTKAKPPAVPPEKL